MSARGRAHVDVLILTALLDELDAVLELGEGGVRAWREVMDPAGLPYHVRSVARAAGRPLELAAAWSGNMGEVAATDRARALAAHLVPRWLVMCGICAGRRGAVAMGDVIVADRVFSYDHGKLIASTGPDGQRQEEIFRDITTYNLRDPWSMKVQYFARDLAWSAELAARRPMSIERQSRWLLQVLLAGDEPMGHPQREAECPSWSSTLSYLERRGMIAYREQVIELTPEGRASAQRDQIRSLGAPLRDPPFRVHVGPIATGKTVRVDPEIFDRIREFSRNAIGIEMEAAAIGYVAERLGVPSLIAKAVSDYGDHDKDDGFRAFACRVSARFVLEFFLRQELDDPVPSGGTFYREGPPEAAPPALGPAITSQETLAPPPPSLPPPFRPSPEPPQQRVAYPEVGAVLGQWRLVGMLGQGGMGMVFRAEHIALPKVAAAKVLHPEIARRSEIVQRFINEARAVAQIKHPGVVDIYDFAIHDSGAPYIIMELLEGVELSGLIGQMGRLIEGEAIAIAQGVAEALAAAHRLGIIHRDLKPNNIFLIDDPTAPSGRRTKVLDFGIAKLAGELDADGVITGTGTVFGSPAYMSPEQIQGSHDVDARADQYSLGCTLFEMVTGRRPFQGSHIASLFTAHLSESPPRLRSLAAVSTQLEEVVARMLEKRPDARFDSMEDVALALSVTAAMLAVSAAGDNAAAELAKLKQARRRTPTPGVVQAGDPLERVLPPHLRTDVPVIRAFLGHVAGGYEQIGPSALRLTAPRVAGAAGFQFFALLLGGASGAVGELGTVTFMHHALPLEYHLATLDRDARKVVIVVCDLFELGRGVREKILDYRNRLDALVVPIYVGEVRKAHRAGRLESLFMERFADFQAVPDLYAASGPLSDPTRFFGMRQVLDELLAELEAPERIAVIHGLPRSGRSSLVRMADYGMSAARFVRVACGELDAEALAAKIAGALDRPGDLGTAARAARDALPSGSLVLVLEDADPLLGRLADPAASEPTGRALWATLVELARARVMSTLATTVRGYALAQRVRGGRANPLAADVHAIEVPRLERETVARLLRDLGAQMNVTASDRVVAGCAELSGGSVDVVRRLASAMLKRHRRDAAHHALRAVELTPGDLQRATEELVAPRGTFEDLLSWLSAAEQRVLRGVAAGRLRDAAALAGDDLPTAEAEAALDELRLLGLVERDGSHERLTIPLLGAWVRRHLRGGAARTRWWPWRR